MRKAFSSLVLAEHNNAKLAPGVYNAVNAASFFEEETILLVAGKDCSSVADEASKIKSVSKVLLWDRDELKHHTADSVADAIAAIQKQNNYKRVLAASSNFSRDVIPRLGGILNVQPISEVTKIMNEECFKRPGYAGNAIFTIGTHQELKLLTIRATAFDQNEVVDEAAPVEKVSLETNLSQKIKFIKEEVQKSERPDLGTAKIVVTGGRGLKGPENFHIAEDLAEVLGGAVGATRAAVDAHYCPNDLQVGQTGKIVAPDLYIALGVSGAIQHLAGMKDSKVIVAINTDGEAPIFEVADYGLVGDVFKVVPEMIEKLKK